jgi:retron-type reverse transcriptase
MSGRGNRTKRTTEAKDHRCGIPQGSPISPLLSNLYMRRFVLAWKKLGLEQRLGSRIVTYADDLVILCRRGKAEEALQWMCKIMGQLKLTVNEDKRASVMCWKMSSTFWVTHLACSIGRKTVRSIWASGHRRKA